MQQLETPVTGLLQQLAATEFFTIFIVGNADFVVFDYSFSVSNYDDLNLLSIIGFYFCALGIVLVKMAMFGVVVTFYVTTLHCKLGFNTQFTHSQTHGFNLMHQAFFVFVLKIISALIKQESMEVDRKQGRRNKGYDMQHRSLTGIRLWMLRLCGMCPNYWAIRKLIHVLKLSSYLRQ